ncbi:MAG: orotidine-5'-phosphate decarboxylase [Candidatus Nealsonbacteria bacterium]
MKAKDRLIFALDVADLEKAISLLDQLEGKIGLVKVNSLAVAYPKIVSIIQDRKIEVWRDFKHHDIPGTVANFINADVKAGIIMTTVHVLGGIEMMEYAVEAAKGSELKILGITILTSHDQESFNKELGIPGLIQDKVKHLALSAQRAGLDGVVASAKEAKVLRATLKPETLIVTPGIKPDWALKRKDQARVTTPYQAILDGADYVVVGSAIRTSENPGEAADKIVEEIEKALSERT